MIFLPPVNPDQKDMINTAYINPTLSRLATSGSGRLLLLGRFSLQAKLGNLNLNIAKSILKKNINCTIMYYFLGSQI